MSRKSKPRTRDKQEIPAGLYDRARKKIGMGLVQIKQFKDAASLKIYCDSLSPQTNPDARPKKGKVTEPPKVDDSMPDRFEIDSNMETNVIRNRAQFDEANKQEELCRIRRIYGRVDPVMIISDSCMVPVMGKNKLKQNARLLVTHYTIIMKE